MTMVHGPNIKGNCDKKEGVRRGDQSVQIALEKHWQTDFAGLWPGWSQSYRDPASSNPVPSLKARRTQTMANQNNFEFDQAGDMHQVWLASITRRLQRCKQSNPTNTLRCQSLILCTLYCLVNTTCEQFPSLPMLYSVINIMTYLYVWLYKCVASWAEWCAAATSQNVRRGKSSTVHI